MLVHSAYRYDSCPIGLTWYGIMICNLQFRHTFNVCKNLGKELVIGLVMQQLHQLGCGRTDNGCMSLHQGVNVSSIQ